MVVHAGFGAIAKTCQIFIPGTDRALELRTSTMSGKTAASTLLDTTVAGTRALMWPYTGSEPAPEIAVLFIPGNPGLCEYYKTFLDTMHASHQLGDRSVVIGLSQLGHDLPRPSAPPPTGRCRAFGKVREYYSLKDQLAMADAAVAEMRAKYAPKPIPLIVMGHSVGAYIAQHVYARAPDQFVSVHLLFPTISHIGATPNGQRLSMLFMPPVALVATWLAALLALLPLALHRALIGVLTSQTQYNAALTSGFLRRKASVFNALNMARDEMRQITDLDPAFVDAVDHAPYRKQTVRTYWGQKDSDSWAPTKWRMHAEAELGLEPLGLHPDFMLSPEAVFDRTLPPRSSTECAVSMPHSFCLEHPHTMARICAFWAAHDVAAATGAK